MFTKPRLLEKGFRLLRFCCWPVLAAAMHWSAAPASAQCCEAQEYSLSIVGVGTVTLGGRTFVLHEAYPMAYFPRILLTPDANNEIPYRLKYPYPNSMGGNVVLMGHVSLLEFTARGGCNGLLFGQVTGVGSMVCAYVESPEIPCPTTEGGCANGICDWTTFLEVPEPEVASVRKTIPNASPKNDPGKIQPPTPQAPEPPELNEPAGVPTSMTQQVGLGRNSSGGLLGRLKWGIGVNTTSVDSSLVTLDLARDGGDTEDKTFADGHRQILSSAVLADIAPVDALDLTQGFVVTTYHATGLSFPPGSDPIPTPAASAKISQVTVQKDSLTLGASTFPGIKVTTQNAGSAPEVTTLYAESNLTGDAGEWIEDRGATATRTLRTPVDNGIRTEVVEDLRRDPVTDEFYVVGTRTLEYETFAWGEELVRTTEGTGLHARTSMTTYYTTPTRLQGKVHVQIGADGSWSRSFYNESTGDLTAVYRPWLDAGGSGPLTPTAVAAIPASACEVTEYAVATGFPLTKTRTVKLKGQLMSREVTTEKSLIDSATGTPVLEVRTEVYRADGQRVSENRVAYEQSLSDSGLERGPTVYQLAGDGSRTTYQETLVEGVTPTRTSVVTRGTYTQPWGEPMKSTQEKTVSGINGVERQETLIALGGGQYATASVRTYTHATVAGDSVTTEFWDGVEARTTTVAEDGTVTTVDESGVTTVSAVDPVTGVQTVTRLGTAVVDNSVTLHGGADLQAITRYLPRATPLGEPGPPAGSIVRSERKAGSVTLLESEQEFDEWGRTVSSKDGIGRITTYAYGTTAQGGSLVTETLPGGATRIAAYHRDGRVASITGTGVVAEYHYYEVSNGSLAETVHYGSASSPRWQRTLTDGSGRTVRTEKPAFGGTELEWTSAVYNDKGQLIKTLSSGGLAARINEYDGSGQLWRQGVDLDQDGALAPSSEDPLVEIGQGYEQIAGQWWQVQRQKIYHAAGPNPESWRLVESRRRLGGGLNEASETIDGGRKSTVTTTVNRSLKKRVVTTTVPGIVAAEEQTYINGMLFFTQAPADLTKTVLAYDAFERGIGVTGPDGGVVNVYDSLGQLQKETRSGSTAAVWETTYVYVAADQPGAGQVAQITAPVSRMKPDTLASTWYGYDALGRQVKQWGSATYPVKYGYNAYGEMESMWTYRTTHGDATQPWDPGNATSGETSLTTWVYDPASGRLAAKKDAANQSVSYTYNAAGQLHSRIWARGAVTVYTYDGAGRLVLQDYADATPDVAYTYHRHGVVRTQTDAAGLHTFSELEADGAPALETVTPAPSGPSLLAGLRFQSLRDAAGRSSGHQGVLIPPGAGSPPLVLPGVKYQYDGRGQLSQVNSGDRQVGYARTLVSGKKVLTLTRAPYQGSATGFKSEVIEDPVLGLVSVKHAQSLTSTTNHHQTRTRTGLRVDHKDIAKSSSWIYQIDARGQVTDARKYRGTLMLPMAGWDAHYGYDDIGNRTGSRFGGGVLDADPIGSESIGYTTNALNQYTGISNPRAAFVTGSATKSSTDPALNTEVEINGQTVEGDTFAHKVAPSGTGPVWEALNFTLTRGADTRSFQQHVYVPPTAESMGYDLDGNLTGDGRWTYTWDAENRLLGMTTQAVAEAAGVPGMKLTFAYDGKSRRIQKKVETRATSSDPWVLRSDTRFVYDGWNMVGEAEYNPTAADAPPVFGGVAGPYWRRTYVWGQDVSGTLQGAGGVGGLLLVNRHERGSKPLRTSWATGDLSGNVIGLVENNLKAVYEYDPFGKPLRVSEPEEDLNPFRFSTKYTDAETGLVYYGYRYYDAVRGRWVNRDPIEEDGGINLYGTCGNDPVNWIDYLGMAWKEAPKAQQQKDEHRVLWIRDSESDTLEMLAKELKLDPQEKDKWARLQGVEKTCPVSVPNIWIDANLLHGGGLKDRVVNLGGLLGRAFTFTGKKRIKINHARDLVETIQKHKHDIIGFSMYAHGGPDGTIAMPDKIIGKNRQGDPIYDLTRYTDQSSVLSALEENGFKLAKAYVMQCYSGFKGTYEHKTYDWDSQWRKRVFNSPKVYQGVNALGIDLKK